MILFPAIDMRNGRCVRLYKGEFSQVTDYGLPLDNARKWVAEGAKWLHLVDLNGAESGKEGNLATIREITQAVDIPVQLGGGIRTIEDIAIRLEMGVARVILGTVCVTNAELVRQAIDKFGSEKIVCGLDCLGGKVAIKGWVETSEMTAYDLAKTMLGYGVKYVVFTDISRDGALTGVNHEATIELMKKTGLNIIASGGLSSLEDIALLSKAKMYGAIMGKSLYANKFTLAQALDATR